MKGTTKVEFEVGGKTMTLETGLLARQADGSVTCGIGANVVFSAVTSAKEAKEGRGLFPASGGITAKNFMRPVVSPGGYIKREARPSEKEILTMRVTDRPIRTLFPDNFQSRSADQQHAGQLRRHTRYRYPQCQCGLYRTDPDRSSVQWSDRRCTYCAQRRRVDHQPRPTNSSKPATLT